jgi:hypothetical protein
MGFGAPARVRTGPETRLKSMIPDDVSPRYQIVSTPQEAKKVSFWFLQR